MESEAGVRSLGAGVTAGCEPPHGCWELSPGSLMHSKHGPSLRALRQLLLMFSFVCNFQLQSSQTSGHGFVSPQISVINVLSPVLFVLNPV